MPDAETAATAPAVGSGFGADTAPPVPARRAAARLPRRTAYARPARVGHMTPVEAPGPVADVLRALAKEHL
ncbi:hypothetical protein RKE29_00325 [Streptomyces sp. B1866]|uniref:hypothetical protein n=1 Tax=Streptomyces sp. B1866 TaxID=3075431 RepID=UPI00288FA499|nr:hypothetical protein [Streptomyces sp. B1866]MDT3395116.1 hypothetical protein [Streptomyces sp. B1866]